MISKPILQNEWKYSNITTFSSDYHFGVATSQERGKAYNLINEWNEKILAGEFRIIALLKKLQIVSCLAAHGSSHQLKYLEILFDAVAVWS